MGKMRNNQIPNGHFHKKWQTMVKTWFDQPADKKRRRLNRTKKAVLIAPRPVAGLLRPAVHCQTQKYNRKLRAGRGFTLEELKAAGVRQKEARSIGIAVDHRRRNKLNTQRLKTYKTKLIVFPRHHKKPKKGDSEPAELAKATQLKGELLPIHQVPSHTKARVILPEAAAKSVYAALRKARSDKRLVGVRAKRALEKEQEEAASAKKEAKAASKGDDKKKKKGGDDEDAE